VALSVLIWGLFQEFYWVLFFWVMAFWLALRAFLLLGEKDRRLAVELNV
jgi:hypothetical protein